MKANSHKNDFAYANSRIMRRCGQLGIPYKQAIASEYFVSQRLKAPALKIQHTDGINGTIEFGEKRRPITDSNTTPHTLTELRTVLASTLRADQLEVGASLLLTWNPSKWIWDNFAAECILVQESEPLKMDWRVLTKRVNIGDRLYLIRLGVAPKGIIASGIALSTPYRLNNERQLRIDVRYDVLLDPHYDQLLSLEQLQQTISSKFTWASQGSGIRIPDEIARKLEIAWANHLANRSEDITLPGEPNSQTFVEGASVNRQVTVFERDRNARSACLAYYGFKCMACGMSFKERYGANCEGIIQVHHLRPLSTTRKAYTVNPVKDLRPVCPNCHVALHSRIPCLSIKELQQLMKKSR